MFKKLKYILVILILLLFFIFFKKGHIISFFGVNTIVNIKIYNENFIKMYGIEKKIRKMVSDFEEKYSVNKQNSIIFKLNRDKSLVNISPELSNMLKKSYDISKKSEGLFDITMQPVLKLWGFDDQNYNIPEKEELEKALKKVSYKNIILENDSVKLKNNSEINLGAFSKGRLIDNIYDLLKERGISRFLIEIGGDIRVFSKTDKPFRVGIKSPRGEDILRIVEIKDGMSIATSGDYERYFIQNGIRYHHILSPFTGQSVRKQASVTVIADNAMQADMLSTLFFLAGHKKTEEFKEKFEFRQVIFIDEGLNESIISK